MHVQLLTPDNSIYGIIMAVSKQASIHTRAQSRLTLIISQEVIETVH